MYKSPGPDKMLPMVLVNVKDSLVNKLTTIFNYSISETYIPSDWKLANVTPIHKKGPKTLVENYRPISLTSVVGKLLESIIVKHITNHLESNRLILDTQHGFRRHRSCLTNLLEFFHDAYYNIDKNNAVDIVYLDFQKAFDTVPHKKLLIKVKSLGIRGKVAAWIEEWLKNRKQRVVIAGEASYWKNVTSGVPQGSVLGPLLFVIYINDIDIGLLCKISKFADDTKIGNRANIKAQRDNIQNDLDRLAKWADTWQMTFNASKCKVMHLGNGNPRDEYKINGEPLQVVESEKDLGVVISSDMKTTKHCIEIEKKCNRLLGYIKRQFVFKNKKIVLTLYNALILPHLQYCVQFWSPALVKDINRLERVQARATKLIPELRHLSYESRLEKLGMPTLRTRRIKLDLVQAYKILHGFDNVDYKNYFTLNENCTRNNGYKLFAKPFNKNVLGNFFTYRVVNYWNGLPAHVVTSPTIETFKRRLDKIKYDSL